jgi:peroxiredoxin
MRTDIIEGATLPDYELPDHTNTRRTLSLLQGNDPMILMLGRGFYCPKDRQQLHELVRFSKQCAVGFTRLVTITTDTFVQLNDLRLGVGADWPFLYDEQRVIQQDLDIPGVYRSAQQSDDTAHIRAGARSEDLQDLQRLLVLGAANDE